MDKILQRSNGKIDIEFSNNNFKKFFQSGCCKILNPIPTEEVSLKLVPRLVVIAHILLLKLVS